MIYSMTGYGFIEQGDGIRWISLEMKGYNHRYLDIQFSLPRGFGVVEEDFRSSIKRCCSRGRIEISLEANLVVENVKARMERACSIATELRAIRKQLSLTGKIRMEHILAYGDISEKNERERVSPSLRDTIRGMFESVLEDFMRTRQTEGEKTLENILVQVDRIRASFSSIQTLLLDIEEHINTRLRIRFAEVLGDVVNEERILMELASLLIKHSVNEEISRLKTHLAQFTQEVQAETVFGKRLDFICQEMNREINTIASKNIMDNVTSHVIEMRDALENIREQLRNIE